MSDPEVVADSTHMTWPDLVHVKRDG